MSKFNFLINLGTYSDSQSSNAPDLNNFNWTRAISGVEATDPLSMTITLAPSETRTVFTGSNVKKFMYLEANKALDLVTNGDTEDSIKPFVVGNKTYPGVYVKTSDITSLELTNPSSTDPVTVYLAAIE